MMATAFLGPRGTFSEEAALLYARRNELDEELVAFASIPALTAAVETGLAADAVLPIENSIEGSVSTTLDLLIHETFPSAEVYAKKAGVPPAFAEQIVNGVHTSPTAAGRVFRRAGARMSVMWHLAVDHDTVGPAHADMRREYDEPVTIAQDLTTFTITREAIVTRQVTIDPFAWPVLGPTVITGPPMSPPNPPPAWWAEALITD